MRFPKISTKIYIIGIVLCAVWTVSMLVVLWLSGAKETAEAFKTGKRFIIRVADGKVTGHQTEHQEPEKAKPEETVTLPKQEEEESIDQGIVNVAANKSETPIPDVNSALIETVAGMSLPRTTESMLKPWQYYMKPYRRPNELPLVGIVITGLGHSRTTTELALAGDERIGLSFSPYASLLASWAAASRTAGHEMFVDLPMQTSFYPAEDPGPYSLLLTRSNADNLKYLQWAMSRLQGYVGLVAPVNEVITANNESFTPLTEEVAKRGVMMLMQRGQATAQNASKQTMVSMYADVWLDEELTEMSIQARLATLEQTAQRNGFAIGIAQAYPLSIRQIMEWQKTLGERGVVLAPVSFITKLKH